MVSQSKSAEGIPVQFCTLSGWKARTPQDRSLSTADNWDIVSFPTGNSAVNEMILEFDSSRDAHGAIAVPGLPGTHQEADAPFRIESDIGLHLGVYLAVEYRPAPSPG